METNRLTLSALQDLAKITEDRPWNMDVQVYSQNTYIPVSRKCFAIMFTNVGDTTARLNGMVVFPSATPTTAIGDSRTIAAHKGDIYKGVLNLSFAVAPFVLPQIEVVQLFYID